MNYQVQATIFFRFEEKEIMEVVIGEQSVGDVFNDFKGRRVAVIKALTDEVDEFFWKCKSRNAMMTWRGLQQLNGMVIPKLAEKKAGPRRYGRMPFLFMPLYNLPTDTSTRESGSFRHK